MQTFKVALIQTPEDRRRAQEIQEAEARARSGRVPEFVREGRGLCRTAKDPDAFTHGDRRSTQDYITRANAARICRACPFSEECLPWAVATDQTGVFGGKWLTGGRVIEGMIRNVL